MVDVIVRFILLEDIHSPGIGGCNYPNFSDPSVPGVYPGDKLRIIMPRPRPFTRPHHRDTRQSRICFAPRLNRARKRIFHTHTRVPESSRPPSPPLQRRSSSISITRVAPFRTRGYYFIMRNARIISATSANNRAPPTSNRG